MSIYRGEFIAGAGTSAPTDVAISVTELNNEIAARTNADALLTSSIASTNGTLSTLSGTVTGLSTSKEDTANKSTTLVADQASDIKFPSVKSVYDWVTGFFVAKTSATGSAILPARTTTERNVDTPSLGYAGYNKTTGQFEGYGASGWGTLGGGAVGGGTDKVFYENDTIITQPFVMGSDALISGATFTNGSATIGFTAHGMVAGSRVFFQTTGGLPTNFAINTGYYVIATGLTADQLQVSATMGGTAITAGSAGTGTHSMGKLKNSQSTGPIVINALTTIPARWVIV